MYLPPTSHNHMYMFKVCRSVDEAVAIRDDGYTYLNHMKVLASWSLRLEFHISRNRKKIKCRIAVSQLQEQQAPLVSNSERTCISADLFRMNLAQMAEKNISLLKIKHVPFHVNSLEFLWNLVVLTHTCQYMIFGWAVIRRKIVLLFHKLVLHVSISDCLSINM